MVYLERGVRGSTFVGVVDFFSYIFLGIYIFLVFERGDSEIWLFCLFSLGRLTIFLLFYLLICVFLEIISVLLFGDLFLSGLKGLIGLLILLVGCLIMLTLMGDLGVGIKGVIF